MKIEEIDVLQDNTISIKRMKLRLEFERIALEKKKAIFTFFSIIIPLVTAVLMVFYGTWSENERAKSNFEIKAIEIVFREEVGTTAANKALLLKELFPDKLPENFDKVMMSYFGNQ